MEINLKPLVLNPGSVSARLGSCLVALGGVAAASQEAGAALVTQSPNLVVPATFDGVYINFLTGATGVSGASVPGWDFNPYLNSSSQLGFFWNNTPSDTSGGVSIAGQYQDIPDGTTIGPSSTFLNSVVPTANFRGQGTHTLGFRFLNEATAQVNYGYLFFTVTGTENTGFPATITSWTYDDSGAPVVSTAVPEPASAATLAAAMAAGAVWMRRRRQLS